MLALVALIVVARPRKGLRTGGGAAASAEQAATVTVESAPIRREASAQAPIVATLARGARITIQEDQGPWMRVRSDRGETGFLAAESAERDADRDARGRRAARILSFPPVFGVVAEDAVIRLAPFPLAPRAGRLTRGSAVSIHAVDHDYYAFRLPDGGIGFVDSSSVDLVPPDPRKPAIVAEGVREPKDVKVTDLAQSEPTPTGSGEDSIGLPEPPETSDEALEPATIQSKVDPVYPESARRAGVEGTVVLDALISEKGRVEDVQVLRGLPMGLSESAEEAVRRWQYRPARGRSGPVASHKTVRIVFTLGSGR